MMNTENDNAGLADAHGSAGIVGRLVEIGDDEHGQPRMIIHTTREAILHCQTNMIFSSVRVMPLEENVTSGRRDIELPNDERSHAGPATQLKPDGQSGVG